LTTLAIEQLAAAKEKEKEVVVGNEEEHALAK